MHLLPRGSPQSHLRWLIMVLRMNYSAAGAEHIVSYFAFALLTPAGTSITDAIRAQASLGHLELCSDSLHFCYLISCSHFATVSSHSQLSRFSSHALNLNICLFDVLVGSCLPCKNRPECSIASFNSRFSNQKYNTQDRHKCKDCSYT